MITSLIKALLGVSGSIYSVLGGSNVASTVNNAITSTTNSSVLSYVQGFMGKLFYFIPKEDVLLILGFSMGILLIRIILSIVAEVWIG